ncbi:chemotaxis protein CheB [Natronobacterium texcoconense]|uniref:protein-glutamate methylesterase n=1 Tax=Natronobacterium texcoconense TaxID=1095778 RepID=A0A1H1B548_NATTX|nr:chemotaxis protein CheB [Natronobacterium texcoconense]SDQ47027.1 two-component system, chemotaxis family, response regulator CheB [Natronobacterium texcoconense]
MTRTLVVDGSESTRTVLGNALADVGYEVELAASGRDALERIDTIDPDVVTLDATLPDVDVAEAIERIMTTNPTPVLLLCRDTENATTTDADAILEGVARDVVTSLEKPNGSMPDDAFVADVVETVADLATVDVPSLALAQTTATARATQSTATGTPSDDRNTGSIPVQGPTLREPTVVVGASTGGPKIAERLLERLPIDLEATVLVVQHMPATFTGRFAERLDAGSEYAVREASGAERVRPGEAVVAPGDADLEVVSHDDDGVSVRLEKGDCPRNVRPSIDVTMESAAQQVTGPLCGVVLSGMGCDGAAGIEAIADAGGHTIAQDEATSPVFGIPCQAIETGCVDEVVPGDALAGAIVDAVTVEPPHDQTAVTMDGETDD